MQKKALEETKAMMPTLRERITSAREKLESVLVTSAPHPKSWPIVSRPGSSSGESGISVDAVLMVSVCGTGHSDPR